MVAFAHETRSFARGSPAYKTFDWEKFGTLERRSHSSNGRAWRLDCNNIHKNLNEDMIVTLQW